MKWRYYYYRYVKVVTVAAALALSASSLRAEDEILGSLQLRGGYDSNPTFSPIGKGTALGGINAVIVAGRTTDDFIAALSAEASYTRYAEAVDAPIGRYKASFDIANKDQSDYSLKSTASIASFRNYDTQSLDAIERVRVQKTDGAVQPFVAAEARYSELNESNVLLGEFLPQPQVYLRGTIIPGVSVKKDGLEVGASVNLSATRYRDDLDLFGFRRDNERAEPFLFLRYNKDRLSLFASLSRLYGDWHDVDFSDVRRNLYEAALTYDGDPVGFELSAKRTAEETTFPISPITIDTLYAGKIRKKLDGKNAVAFFARYYEKAYLDSNFVQRSASFGAQFTHDISDKTSFGLELARNRMSPISGPGTEGIVAIASLTQRFNSNTDDKKRAGSDAPAR
jgi:hypothetical protein